MKFWWMIKDTRAHMRRLTEEFPRSPWRLRLLYAWRFAKDVAVALKEERRWK